ncbi:MAG TPA: hypothetical protein VIK75_10840, partial [Calditerricola sp.]
NNLARYVAEGDFWQFYEAGTNVHVVLNRADGGLYAWTGSTWAPAVAGAGSGTVTSVDVSADASIADVFDTSGGPVTSSGSVSITAVDAGADRIVFWDASESKLRYLEVGSNLSITGTVLNATGGGGGSERNTVTALSGSGSVAVDYSLGDYFTLELSGDVSGFTFSNLPGPGKGATLMIRITQDSTPRTVTWPSSFKWAGGSAPSVSTGSGAVDVLAITTFDNGTSWQATLAKAFA